STSIYIDLLSLHDALPIYELVGVLTCPHSITEFDAKNSNASVAFDLSENFEYVVLPNFLISSTCPLYSNSTNSPALLNTRSGVRSEEHTSELQSRENVVCR